jgi:hypothetical protein
MAAVLLLRSLSGLLKAGKPVFSLLTVSQVNSETLANWHKMEARPDQTRNVQLLRALCNHVNQLKT